MVPSGEALNSLKHREHEAGSYCNGSITWVDREASLVPPVRRETDIRINRPISIDAGAYPNEGRTDHLRVWTDLVPMSFNLTNIDSVLIVLINRVHDCKQELDILR